jgi:hypothetical protein
MRAKGITYDTGFIRNGAISRERFDPDMVGRELGSGEPRSCSLPAPS